MFSFKSCRFNSVKFLSHSCLAIIIIFTFLLGGCEKQVKSSDIICNLDPYSSYPKVLKEILPLYNIEQFENQAYYTLEDGNISEAFDIQASGALGAGIAEYWYPQYLATVIIALDRDMSNVLVNSWSDLLIAGEEVAFSNSSVNNKMLTAAIAYGLEGQDYTLKKAINLLSSLHKNSLLNIDSFDSPIIICYDYQAAALREEGRNIEIVVPSQGTLTYEKGLLTNENLTFRENTDEILFQNNFRLLDGESNLSIYPDKSAYHPAVKVTSYEHFAKTTRNVSNLIERRVLNSKRFMSIDYREHLYFALIYISLITIWVASVILRSMQKGTSYAAFFTGLILNSWALVRLIKYQVVVNQTLIRYLWYSYYIFQLSLPLVILWMAWAMDKPPNQTLPPKWWRRLAVLISILIILVFTNDLHGLVFQLDLNRPDWGENYTYGLGYYIILLICMTNIFISFAIMLKKSIKNPRKKGFVFPLGIFILFVLYNYKYIIRDSFVYKTDITIVTGIFAMLMFEACIRSGLIPVNTKYIDIFIRSPLKIQILNKERTVQISSGLAGSLNKDVVEKVIASSPHPILQEDESLLFANSIPGGYTLWSQDISRIQKLHRQIEKSTEKLSKANAMLVEEEKIKRQINEKNAKKELMEQLETDIKENVKNLSNMIEKLEHSENHLLETTRVALLLSYIKRRCNLFFKEKEMKTIEVDKLVKYINELCQVSKYSNLEIVSTSRISGKLLIRHATLFYDFFYTLADLSIQKSCPYIIVDIGYDEELITMKLLPSSHIGFLESESKLMEGLESANGKLVKKDIEDTVGISISFPKGGGYID